MQDLLKNERIIPLLKRRKSRDLAENISYTIKEKKQKIEKIKNLIKENKKETKQLTTELLKNFKESETNQSNILKKELSIQEINFQKKLEVKKMEKQHNMRRRVSSQPHIRIYNMLKESTESSHNLENPNQNVTERRVSMMKKSSTPPRKKSNLSIIEFNEEEEKPEEEKNPNCKN